MKNFLSSLLALAVLIGLAGPASAADEKRPNILFIMTDQQRWDALGCTGGWVDTPNLDALARESVLFSNCVTTSPVCLPARWSLAS